MAIKTMGCWLLLCVSATAFAQHESLSQCPGAQHWLHSRQQAVALEADVPGQPHKREQLLAMADQDQAIRAQLNAAGVKPDVALLERLRQLDGQHAAQLAQWMAAGNLPTAAQVGSDGMQALWLLVQHADAYPALQEQLLAHYSVLPDWGGMGGGRGAMLVDRVLRAQNQPQRFGTQFGRDAASGTLTMDPVEDATDLDAVRAAAGLMPMADYMCVLRAAHGG